MPQARLRAALAALIASGRVISAPLPKELRHGGRKDYLHPVAATSSGVNAGRDEVGRKSTPSSSVPETASTSSLPYREKIGDDVDVTNFSQPAYHFGSMRGNEVVTRLTR